MRLIPSFCALACASALPLAAPAQTAAETPAPETAPETAGRTVLDVTASGTLTGLAADALGPDAALTVRLHGPVAFDVDTADFASLEIFADDPAVKLTVSDTAAYDRITAVSIPAAASGEPAAATFSAAAASAGIATLADGGTTTSATPDASIQVTGTMALSEQLGATSDPVVQATFSDGSTLTVDTTAFSSLILVGPETGAATVEVTSDVATATPLKALLPKVDFTQASNVTLVYRGAGNDATARAWVPILGENAKIVIDGQLVLANASVTEQALTLSDGATLKVLSALSTDLVYDCQARAVAVMFAEHPQNPTVTISGSGTRFDVPNGVVALARDGGPQVTVSDGAVFSAYKLGNTRNDNPRMTVDGATLCLGKADATDGLLQMEKGVLTLREATLSANGDWAVSDSSAVGSILLDGKVTVRPNGQSIALQKLAAVPDTAANLVIDGAASANEGIAAGGTVKLQGAFSMPVTMKDVTVAGSCTVSGDVTIEGNVTLKVSEAAQPTWLVDGSLIIAEGATLTVQLDTGVTLANPHCLIQAGAISGSIAVTAGEGMESLKPVQVGTSVWVISNGSIRPKNPVSDGMSWRSLLTSEWVTEGGVSVTSPVQITTESSVVLELANGATLTVDESILDSGSVPELALRVTGGGTATIAVSDGCRFPFAKTTVAAGTVRVEGAADLGAVTIADGATLEVTHPFTSVAGSGTLVLDATAGNIEVDPTLRDSIRTRDAKVILRSNTSGFGVTLDYGVNVNASFQAHLVVESGTHKMTYGQGGAYDFSTTGTTANPTIWVKQGATLEFTAKDISGWTGAANHKAVIRVDGGGYLKIWKKASNTFYYRQCLYLEPGADMEIGSGFSSENKFRLIGGTEEATAQIFVPDSAQAGTEAATISGGSLTLGNDATNGLAISVGNNSELKIDSELSNHSGSVSPELAKYGSGVLTLSSVDSAFRSSVTVNAGTMRLSGVDAFGSGAVTLQSGATLEIVEGSNSATTTALSNTISGEGTLMVTSGSVSLNGNTVACDVSVKAGASLGGTGTITDTLTFADDSTLDASAGVLTVSGLMLPASGTVTVNVAAGAVAGSEVLRLSSGSASLAEAKKFAASGVEGMTVLAQGRAYVLAPLSDVMPENGTVTATVSADSGTTVQWSTLTWSDSSATYPSAGAGATNDLTLTIPYGVTLEMDQNVSVKSLTVRVTGEASAGPAQLTVAADMAFEPGSLALTEGALAVASATAVSGVSIAEGATLTVGHAGALGTSGIITGAGTLAVTGNGTQPTNKTGLTEDTWTGNVRFTGDYDALAIASYGHSESTVTFAGATGHLAESGVCAANVMLEGNGWESDNGWEGDTLTFSGTLSGSGSLTIGTTPSNGHLYKFTGDVSAFAGSITVNGKSRVSFGDVSSVTNGRIHVGSGKTAQIASGKTWSATIVEGGATFEVQNNSTVADLGITVRSGGVLKPMATPASCTASLTLEAGAILDRTTGAINIGAKPLTMPETGTVTVRVASDFSAGTLENPSYVVKTTDDDSLLTKNAAKFVVEQATDTTNPAYQIANDLFIVKNSSGYAFGELDVAEGSSLPEADTALAAAVQQAAAASGATSVTVAYGTSGGTQLDAATAEAGATLFTGITTTTTEASTTTVTVAYDFGITGITVGDFDDDGIADDIQVTAKVQNMSADGTANLAAFASDTTVTLCKDGAETGVTGTIGNDGTVTFTLSDGLSGIDDNTAAKFTVKAEKATP